MSASPGTDGTETLPPGDFDIAVPECVAHRVFGAELVLLNLDTGQYHGLNATARRMFELMADRRGVRGVSAVLAADYGMPESDIENDLRSLCAALAERGLIEITAEPCPPSAPTD